MQLKTNLVAEIRITSAAIKSAISGHNLVSSINAHLEVRAAGKLEWGHVNTRNFLDTEQLPISVHLSIPSDSAEAMPVGSRLRLILVDSAFDFGPDTCHTCGNENPRTERSAVASTGEHAAAPCEPTIAALAKIASDAWVENMRAAVGDRLAYLGWEESDQKLKNAWHAAVKAVRDVIGNPPINYPVFK